MDITLQTVSPEKPRTGVLVVCAFADGPLPPLTRTVDEVSKGKLAMLIKRGDLEAKAGASLLLHDLPGVSAERVLLVSLGTRQEFGDKAFRDALGSAARTLAGGAAKDAAVTLTDLDWPGRSLAWRLAQAQSEGARSVQGAMEALASGSPRLPDWISTDELGDLAVATARVFEQLKAFSLSLGDSADALKRSAEELGMSTSKQSEVLTLQATALQETQVTAQEIKQTSALASQKAEGVLQQTERADSISQAGNEAIQKSLGGLLDALRRARGTH